MSHRLTSIRLRLVLLLVFLFFTAIVIDVWHEVLASRRQLEQEARMGAGALIAHVAPTLERLYGTGDAAGVEALIAGLGPATEAQAVVLLDPAGRIAASSPPSYRGRTLAATPLRDAIAVVRRATATRQARVEVRSASRAVVAVAPISIRPPGAAPSSAAPRLLVITFDLKPRLTAARLRAYGEGLWFAGICGLGLLLIWLFLDFSVTRPATRITHAADRLAEGDRNARTALSGRDEIQRAGRAFDRMADRIQGAEAETRRARAMLDAVLRQLPVGVIAIRRDDGGLLFVNDRWLESWGRPLDPERSVPEQLQCAQLERPDGSPFPVDQLAAPTVMRTGRPAEVHDLVHVQPDGQRVPLVITAAPVTIGDGPEFDAVVSVVQYRHELERALSELREWERRFEAVVEATGQVVYECDIRAEVARRSGSVQTVLGYAPGELDASCDAWRSRIHPDDRDAVLSEVDACQREGRRFEMTYRFLHKDGSWRVIRDCGFFQRNESGEAVRMLGTWTDVTDQHRLEEQLRHAQRLETVGTLAGGVAHDFNNQLTGVIGHLDLLGVSLAPDDSRQEHVQAAREAADRCAELTRGLLAFSRQLSTRPRRASLNDIVTEVAGLLPRTLPESVRLTLDLEPEPWPALADPEQIRQVLMNLCLNARDAMPDGGELRIRTRRMEVAVHEARRHPEARPGRFVELAVSDSGRGIPPEIRARVFDPFFTTRPFGAASGLGLAMAYGIVASHRGWIELESQTGAGSTFRVYLPAAESELESNHAPAADDAFVAAPASGPRATLLVVDDETVVREIAARVLENAGYRVLTAGGGHEAIELFRAHRGEIAAVVLDLSMPGLSGHETSERLLALEPGVPIVLSSGYSEQPPDLLRAHGAAAFLVKPYGPQQLLAVVRESLAVAPRWSAVS